MAEQNDQQAMIVPGSIEQELDLDLAALAGDTDGGSDGDGDDTVAAGEGNDTVAGAAGDDAGDGKGEGDGSDDGDGNDDGAAAGKDGDGTGEGAGQSSTSERGAGDASNAGGSPKGEGQPATDPQKGSNGSQQLTDEQVKAQREEQRKAAEAFKKWEDDFTALEQKLQKNEFDPFDDSSTATAMKLLTQGFNYFRQAIGQVTQHTAAQQQAQGVEAYWNDWGATNKDIGAERGRALLAEEYQKARAKGYEGDTALAVATEKWNDRIERIRNGKKAGQDKGNDAAAAADGEGKPKNKPAPTITRGGGRITPAGGSNASRPPAKAKTTEEKLESGEYGDLAAIV